MNILFTACYSPIVSGSASIITLYYLNELSNIKGIDIELVTVDYPKDFINYDENLLKMLDNNVNVHFVNPGKLFNKTYPKKNNNLVISSSSKLTFKSKIRKIVKNAFAIPDSYFIWAIKSYLYINKLKNNKSYDLIISMHEPPSSLISGYLIKKKYKNAKWITYWSDPWTTDRNRQNYNNIRKYIEFIMERKFVKTSDKLLFTSDTTRDEYINKYKLKQDKTDIVYKGYDLDEFYNIKKRKKPEYIANDKINLVYTGEIYSELRDITPFLKSLKKIQKENTDLYNKINVLIIGNIDNQKVKEEAKSVSCVNLIDRVTYKKSLEYIIHSDILILWGNKNSTQIPAKIYDYLGAFSPILTILGDKEDPLTQFTEEYKKCIAINNNIDDIYLTLEDIIENIDKRKEDYLPVNEYDWSNIALDLYNKIRLDD